MHRRAAQVWLGLAVIASTAACKREPSFDERYASAQKAISEKAVELDKDMATRAADSEAVAGVATDAASEQPAESKPAAL